MWGLGPVSGMGGRIDAILAGCARLTRKQAWGITMSAIVATQVLDYLSNPLIWFGPLYLLIICLPTWAIGARAGIIAGILCLILGILANGTNSYPNGEAFLLWNMMMRALPIAIIVALVAGMRRSYDREWHNARIDHLTGALTKRGFLDKMAAAPSRGWAVLAYLDLDGFKAINDRHGHAMGDNILQLLARSVFSITDPEDCLARIGGDEFLLHMWVDDADEARGAIQRVHDRVNMVLAAHGGGCSIGALILGPDMRNVGTSEIEAADRLMYLAKQDGGCGLRVGGDFGTAGTTCADLRQSGASAHVGPQRASGNP
jgi:diguanylate cyclase (GGDEF)-like protein